MDRRELKECIAATVGEDLGKYARPQRSDYPAVWVKDRPIPANWRMIKAEALDHPLIPAFEVIIMPEPVPDVRVRAVNHIFCEYLWKVIVTQHDSRQPFSGLIERMFCVFPRVRSPVLMEATDLYNATATFLIPENLIQEVA